MTESISDTSLVVAGEQLVLLPQGGIFWSRTHTLLIADLQFGRADQPTSVMHTDLARLVDALERVQPDKLIVLGDFLTPGTDVGLVRDVFSAWRQRYEELAIFWVRDAAHPLTAEQNPLPEWRVRTVDGPTPGPVFAFNAVPVCAEKAYTLAGHLHPAISVGTGPDLVECFWFGARVGVLPAFGSGTALREIDPRPDDYVYAIVEDRVQALPA